MVTVSGQVDVHTAPRLGRQLDELIAGGATRIVVDLARVDFMDSSGLGVLLAARRRLEPSGGALSLTGVPPRIVKILEVTGLTGAFAIHPAPGEAMPGPAQPRAAER